MGFIEEEAKSLELISAFAEKAFAQIVTGNWKGDKWQKNEVGISKTNVVVTS